MGRVIIFPTDTVYGIGTKIFDLEGIERIYKIKNRPKSKPLACLCYDINQIESIANLTENAKKLAKNFLPGGLTLVVESKPEVYQKIGYKTIGVRIPNSKIALSILKENGPMLTTSVNDSGMVPLNEYHDIFNKYHDIVDFIYDTDSVSTNVPSTVISFNDQDEVVLLREGNIKLSDLNKCLYSK